MAGDHEQTDSSGKYTFGGGSAMAKKYWPTVLKSIELVCCILCIGLIDDPAQNSRIRIFVTQRTVSLCYATFATFLIISAVFLIGKVIRDDWPWKTLSILACTATLLFLICGVFLLKDWSDTKERNFWPPNTTSNPLDPNAMNANPNLPPNMNQNQNQNQMPTNSNQNAIPMQNGNPLDQRPPTKGCEYYPQRFFALDLLCATGFICLITSIVFLIDLILLIRAGNRGELDN